MRKFSVLVILLLGDHAAFAKTLNVRKAIEYALSNSNEIKNAKISVAQSGLKRSNAFYKFFPSLDSYITSGVTGQKYSSSSLINNEVSGIAGLTLQENLYDNGTGLINYDTAILDQKTSELGYRQKINELTYKIFISFCDLSNNREKLTLRTEQLNHIEKQHKFVSTQYRQGFKLKKDFLSSEAQLQRLKIQIIGIQDSIQQEKLRLLAYLGLDARNTDGIDEFENIKITVLEPVPVDREAAIKNNPELLISELNVGKKELDARLAQRAFYPGLYLTGNMAYTTDNIYHRYSDTITWSGFITLKYNIFSWGIQKREKDIAAMELGREQNTHSQNIITFERDLDSLIRRLHTANQEFHLSKKLFEIEEENLNNIGSDYRRGIVQFLDLIVAWNNYLSSKDSYITSFYDYQKYRAEYLLSRGTIYEDLAK